VGRIPFHWAPAWPLRNSGRRQRGLPSPLAVSAINSRDRAAPSASSGDGPVGVRHYYFAGDSRIHFPDGGTLTAHRRRRRLSVGVAPRGPLAGFTDEKQMPATVKTPVEFFGTSKSQPSPIRTGVLFISVSWNLEISPFPGEPNFLPFSLSSRSPLDGGAAAPNPNQGSARFRFGPKPNRSKFKIQI